VITLTTKAELRAACEQARARGERVGLVPTMGYFHEGHRSLMRAARATTDFVVVTLFVNPTQFGPSEDLAAYPRDVSADTAAAAAERTAALFVPTTDEMYTSDAATTVHVARITEGMCGAARPMHLDGVATIVTKLFAIVGPCTAIFGRKDAQQLAVIRRLVADLDLPVEVVGAPIVRESDGLALSSRNAYLGADERGAATVLFRALAAATELVVGGARSAQVVGARVRDEVAAGPLVELEYVEVRNGSSLEAVDELNGTVLIAIAARVGATRLIDNVTLTIEGDTVVADLGTRS
jgi:pantoate--beta-alanine ligase